MFLNILSFISYFFKVAIVTILDDLNDYHNDEYDEYHDNYQKQNTSQSNFISHLKPFFVYLITSCF